jgi:hypothetical protein
VQALGTTYGGAEIWTCGFYLGHEAQNAPVPSQANADAIGARWQTFFTSASVGISHAVSCTALKVSRLGTDGKTILSNTQYHNYTTPLVGGGLRNIPPQVALAVSFKSGIARGPGANGRMYLPQPAFDVQSTGHLNSADIGPLMTAAKTLFDGINSDMSAITGGPVYLINASKGNAAKGEAPVNSKIVSIRIGDVVDTIQRRRDHLREVYQTLALA